MAAIDYDLELRRAGATATGGISANPMGSADAEFGDSNQMTTSWITGSTGTSSGVPWPIYALSSPITVPAPEPGMLSLLGAAVAGFGGAFFVRRRAKNKV